MNSKFSNNFLNKLKTKPELEKKFNIVDIEKLQVIPNEVEEVPCVYDGKSIYQGKAAFTWLNEKMSDFLSAANGDPIISATQDMVLGCYYLTVDNPLSILGLTVG